MKNNFVVKKECELQKDMDKRNRVEIDGLVKRLEFLRMKFDGIVNDGSGKKNDFKKDRFVTTNDSRE